MTEEWSRDFFVSTQRHLVTLVIYIKDHWARQIGVVMLHSTSFNMYLTLYWAQLGTDICQSESPISLHCFVECNLGNHLCNGAQNLADSEKDVRACWCLFSCQKWDWERRQGKGRKEGKGAGRRSAKDLPTAGRSHNYYLCHLSQKCLSTVHTMPHVLVCWHGNPTWWSSSLASVFFSRSGFIQASW